MKVSAVADSVLRVYKVKTKKHFIVFKHPFQQQNHNNNKNDRRKTCCLVSTWRRPFNHRMQQKITENATVMLVSVCWLCCSVR